MPPPPIVLRDYQVRAIAAARALVARGVRRIVLVSPTGSGKTLLACELIRGARAKGSRALFLAHRKELVDQCSEKLDRWGIDHGVIMADHPRRAPDLPVQVASVQTLIHRTKPPADLVFVDECHHSRAISYEKILDAYPEAPVLGLTATPWRHDGKGLSPLFAESILVARPKELVEQGHLVPYDGFLYRAVDTTGVRKCKGDFAENELERLVLADKNKAVIGDIVQQYIEHCRGKRALVFAVGVAHSRLLAQRFVEAGIAAEHLDGTTPMPEREAILARFAAGATPVVCNCNVLTEGFDCPAAEVAILARPTMSLVLYLQMVGRIMRPVPCACGQINHWRLDACPACGAAPTKRAARIHDHAGNIARIKDGEAEIRHGLPDAERDYSLRGDKAPPLESLTHCPKCYAIHLATLKVCPVCGYVYEEEEEEDADEPTGGGGPSQIAFLPGVPVPIKDVLSGAPPSEAAAVDFLYRLLTRARERGYKPGWASYLYKHRYGSWPPREWLAKARNILAATDAIFSQGSVSR